MRVCYFGTYRAGYNRNKIMISALKSAGVEVITCQENLWYGIEDREHITAGGWRSPKFWWRVIKTYIKLMWKFFSIGKFDVMVLGYPGQFDVFLGKLCCGLKRKKLVWDVFMSVYLVAVERKLEDSRYSAVRMIKRLEKKALSIPDLLIQDTRQYVDWFFQTYGVETERFRLVPTGADDSIFKPIDRIEKMQDKFRILYYGTFIANHGLDHIVEAAKLLASQGDSEFLFIGEGPEKPRIVSWAETGQIKNLTFLDWCPQSELVKQIGLADICLGAFGSTPQSLMTVQNKIYECMACGKAIITGVSPAVQSQFTDEVELKMCERKGEAIADTIVYLRQNPEILHQMGLNARQSFESNYSTEALGKTFRSHLEELLSCN